MLFVRRDGHLGRDNIHIDITPVQIVRTQTFKVTGKLFTRILVIALEERSEVSFLQFKQSGQLFVAENRIANDIDVTDRSHRAFLDINLDTHTITRLLDNFGINMYGLTALGHILALQLVAYPLKRRLLKDLTLGQSGLFQAFKQVILLDRLVTADINRRNGRALNQVDHQYFAITSQTNVLEKAGTEQRAGCFSQLFVINLIANIKWQGSKNTTGRDALQAIETNIRHRERGGRSLGADDCGNCRG